MKIVVNRNLSMSCSVVSITNSYEYKMLILNKKSFVGLENKEKPGNTLRKTEEPSELQLFTYDSLKQRAKLQHGKYRGKLYGTIQLCECDKTISCPQCSGTGICASCDGEKQFECPVCNGDKECISCKGTGIYTCTNCDGGWNCKECHGSGKCSHCHGDGGFTCKACGGSGSCGKCKGKGMIWCPNCHGNGKCFDCKGEKLVQCPRCKGLGEYQSYTEYSFTDSEFKRELCSLSINESDIQSVVGYIIYNDVIYDFFAGRASIYDDKTLLEQVPYDKLDIVKSWISLEDNSLFIKDKISKDYLHTTVELTKIPVTRVILRCNDTNYTIWITGNNRVVFYDDLPSLKARLLGRLGKLFGGK